MRPIEIVASAPSPARSGRAGTVLAAALGLAAVLAGLWLLGRGSGSGGALEPGRVDAGSPAAGAGSAGDVPGELPAEDRGRGSAAAEDAPRSAPSRDEFEGRGSIRGEVHVRTGAILPERFHVVVGPSRVLRGRERAAERSVAVAGTREFVVEDLPLGGYDVRIEAPGLNSQVVPVLLVRGSADPFVMLEVYPTGFIDGRVIDAGGAPVEGLAVTLERSATLERREAITDPAGLYSFEDVRDGEYRIFFGPPERPLAGPRELSFQAPAMNFPQQQVPVTATLQIRVVDAKGSPSPLASVSGYGNLGGVVQETADALGEATARFLPQGTYRFTARDTEGRRGTMTADVIPGEPNEVVIPVQE